MKDISGIRFGRLVARKRVVKDNDTHHTFWECECDCGGIVVVRTDCLKNGNTKSCGCLVIESGKKPHGYSKTKIYSVYNNMKDRCYNPNSTSYSSYGGRGIKICQEWLNDVNSFISWSYENGYYENDGRNKLSIDRIDVNGDYCPENCRWADKDVQNYNKRETVKVIVNNQEKTLLDLHNEYGISLTVLRGRYKKYISGIYTIEQLLSINKIENKPHQVIIEVDGEKHNLTEWEKITGVSRKTIMNRYNKGMRLRDDLFNKDC